MNRDQAKAAMLAVDKSAMTDVIDWGDARAMARQAAERAASISNPDDHEVALKVAAILREHRDYLRTENEALGVWCEVFVARCAIPDHHAGGAAVYADEAETRFRRRLADHLKAVG